MKPAQRARRQLERARREAFGLVRDRARLKDALALETNGQLADAVRLYLDIYTRHQANDLGHECLPHLAASAFSLHLLKPTAMPLERALSLAQEASRRHPGDVHVWRVLGTLYERALRWGESVAALEAALAALPGTELDERRAMVHFDLAHVFQCSGDPGRSRVQLERVAEFSGTPYGAFRAGILARLRLGRYEAFAELDAHHSLTHDRPGHPWPAWRGEPLQGRLLVDTEAWGFGDIWQHLRWIPLAQAQVGSVTVLAPPNVTPMVRDQFEGVTVVTSVGELIEPPEAWVWAMSLPEQLGIRSPADLLPAPYLRAPIAFRALPGAFRVGLVWAGSPEHSNDPWRSTRLAQWAPVLDVPGVTFYSLQLGPAVTQLREAPGETVHDLAPELTDWTQTAAAMAALDLVLGVDCGPINFAGALGVPLWVCLAANCDYRWGLEGAQTPWYPSARLFRQPTAGDWASVSAEEAAALRELVGRRRVEAA